MSTLSKPEPRAVAAPLTPGGVVTALSLPPAVWRVCIPLPEQGDALNGQALCERLRRVLRAHPGRGCLLLEGTGMVTAQSGFTGALKELDREWGERLEVVCAIPLPIPRLMAHTVATRARAPWHIFRTRAEADAHLRQRGYLAEDGRTEPRGPLPLEWSALS